MHMQYKQDLNVFLENAVPQTFVLHACTLFSLVLQTDRQDNYCLAQSSACCKLYWENTSIECRIFHQSRTCGWKSLWNWPKWLNNRFMHQSACKYFTTKVFHHNSKIQSISVSTSMCVCLRCRPGRALIVDYRALCLLIAF